MTTFLWMLYLAFTLFMTCGSIITIIQSEIMDYNKPSLNDSDRDITNIGIGIVALLWSIWYFYFLN